MSDSSAEEADGLVILCSRCKVNVIFTEPKEKPSQVVDTGQRQRVFDRLGHQTRIDEQPSTRQCLNFNTSFYNDDYYARNSSSSSSSVSQNTFKPPEPRDQRWYNYNSSTVFSTVSLFGLTANEKECVARLDAYLDMRDARIAYQELACKASQGQDRSPTSSELKDSNQNEMGMLDVEDIPKHDTLLDNPEDDDHNPMGPSVLDNIEISMVHVLPIEFQPTTTQPNFLDGDVVAEEAT
ncbi:plasma membrane ATPase 1-like [Pyrus ussuriensis x Pyrus communis]|uniref:Plasma membrane ATPase 1-like n=1 Tax=Pyrus ussuriensis x Pyrus communis TaxID=2448454 RepID=A0A5N5I1J5_9ROSA|nr:plasma membrane ATPase 1-like [Pyrus ussuriensis x Pyrus communis]